MRLDSLSPRRVSIFSCFSCRLSDCLSNFLSNRTDFISATLLMLVQKSPRFSSLSVGGNDPDCANAIGLVIADRITPASIYVDLMVLNS